MTTISFATLGCRVNQVDTEETQGRLESRGFTTVPFESPADVVVINTCAVTVRAECSDRQLIRRAARRNPAAKIVVTGCWAQTDRAAVETMADVDLVVGRAERERLPDLVAELLGDLPRATGGARTPPSRRRSRAFLKVQDGCQHRCAFCIVPRARGESVSRDPEAILDQARTFVAAGHPEIVLTGIDLGHYGADLAPRTSLANLVRRLGDVRGLRWLRLSSILPAYFTPELMETITASGTVVPHLHVPLQSGSDAVLRRMRRPYNARLYRRLVESLADAIPDLGLGTDLIAGFPGERDEDARATDDLVAALPFSYLHVFGYSQRPGTEAAGFAQRVPAAVAAERSERLRAIGDAKHRAFRRRMLGRQIDAIALGTRDRATRRLVGLTGNYLQVVFDGSDGLMGRLVTLDIAGEDGSRLRGAVAR